MRGQVGALALVFGATVAIAAVAPAVSLLSAGRIGVMDLMNDPAEVTGIPWYVGIVHSMNLLVWAGAAALHLVAAAGLRRRCPRLAVALAGLGGLSVLFAFDDLLLLHEVVVPWILGFPEALTFALYAVCLAGVLLRYRTELLGQPEASILVLALVALAASVALDLFGWDRPGRRIAEEVLKLLGATAWAAFPGSLTVRRLMSAQRERA